MIRYIFLALLAAAPGWSAATAVLGVCTASTSNVAVYTSGSFTPAAGDLLVTAVLSTGTTDVGSLTDTQALGWTLVNHTTKNSSADTLYLFVADAFASNSAMTVSFRTAAAGNATGAVINVIRISGMSRTGSTAVVQSAVTANHATGSAPSVTFSGTPLTTDVMLAFFGNATNPAGATAPTSWNNTTAGCDTGYATPTTGFDLATIDSGFTSTTVTWGSTSASAYGVIGVEMNTAAASGCASPCPTLVSSLYISSAAESGNTFIIPWGGATGTGSLANNLMVAFVHYPHGATVSSVSDSTSTSWTASAATTDSGTNGFISTLYYRANVPAGVTSLTVTFGSAVADFHASMKEFYNIATSTPIDGTCASSAATAPLVQCGSTVGASGDLVVSGAIDLAEATGMFGQGSTPTSIAGWNGIVLETGDIALGGADGYEVVGAAVNPSFTVVQPTDDGFNVIGAGFKAASAGTAPSGAQIAHQYFIHIAAATQNFEFPFSGNTITLTCDSPNNNTGGNVITMGTSTPALTWTKYSPGADTSAPQEFYTVNATASPVMIGSLSSGNFSNSSLCHFYDMVGMTSTAHEQDTTNNCTSSCSNTITSAPSITPNTALGISFDVIAIGTGPITAVASGFLLDNVPYTGQTDSSHLNNGNAFGHKFYTSTAAQSWGYTQTMGSGWHAIASTFEAPIGNTLRNMTLLGVGP